MFRKHFAAAVACAFLIVSGGVCAAENFPASASKAQATVRVPGPNGGPQRFYGYVPPPPIRDTWPGGYRVIFHELREMLLNHIQGYY